MCEVFEPKSKLQCCELAFLRGFSHWGAKQHKFFDPSINKVVIPRMIAWMLIRLSAGAQFINGTFFSHMQHIINDWFYMKSNILLRSTWARHFIQSLYEWWVVGKSEIDREIIWSCHWWNLFKLFSAQLSLFQPFFDQSRWHLVEFTSEL